MTKVILGIYIGSCIYKVLNGSNLDGPKVVSSYQNSPLFWASKYKDFEMMRLILLAGVPMGSGKLSIFCPKCFPLQLSLTVVLKILRHICFNDGAFLVYSSR
jgi:hypothetical protein